jgi:hypothetical protein
VASLPSARDIVENLGSGLLGAYTVNRDSWSFEGRRPGPAWHRHGRRSRRLIVVLPAGVKGVAVKLVTVYRQRWRLAGTNQTIQDRSPDEVGQLHVVVLVLLLKLWSYLSSARGLLHYEEVVPALLKHGCERTIQRWLKRIGPSVLAFEQAVVQAAIERSEPRPVEQLFPGGLSPPDTLMRRHWLDPARTSTLWQGLAWTFGGAIKLGVSTTALLAEVRRRTPDLTLTS